VADAHALFPAGSDRNDWYQWQLSAANSFGHQLPTASGSLTAGTDRAVRGELEAVRGSRSLPRERIVQSPVVRVAIGADHAGFLLKEHLKLTLQRLGHHVDDHGTHNEESVDYPPICLAVGRSVAEGRAERGIVCGGSGQGEQIAANKVPGVRAALCHDLYLARLSRQHNDANVLSMGGRVVAFGLADEIMTLWLSTPFDGGRHQRRIDQIGEAERNYRTQ
jgi:ribose 5-phosphate isomerase B